METLFLLAICGRGLVSGGGGAKLCNCLVPFSGTGLFQSKMVKIYETKIAQKPYPLALHIPVYCKTPYTTTLIFSNRLKWFLYNGCVSRN